MNMAYCFSGMCTKICEATLGVKYRIKDKNGAYAGGSMYFIQKSMGQGWQGCGFSPFSV
jgi:AGCS family alanine or glycine:cation symporter